MTVWGKYQSDPRNPGKNDLRGDPRGVPGPDAGHSEAVWHPRPFGTALVEGSSILWGFRGRSTVNG